MKVLLLIFTVGVGIILPGTLSVENRITRTTQILLNQKSRQGRSNEKKAENVTYSTEIPQPIAEEQTTERPKVKDGPKCGRPPALENSKLDEIQDEYSVGSNITYKCDFGYVTQGRGRTIECVLKKHGKVAKWTNLRISCVPRSCGDPGYVPNARRVGSLFTFPNEVIFQCEEGYKIKGSTTRYCLASGTWSGKLPECEKVSCSPPESPENGRAVYWSLEYGSELTYECNKGYIIENSQPRICSGIGTWSGNEPECVEAACEPPTAPQHGSVNLVGGRAKVDSIAVYSCHGDRIMVGSATSKCLSTGQWTFDTPQCLNQCTVPYITDGRLGKYEVHLVKRNREYFEEEVFVPSRIGLKVTRGQELSFQCKKGYTIAGELKSEDSVLCEDGTWSQALQCVSTSCEDEPPATPNGYIVKIDKNHGGTITYYCNKGYTKEKYGNVTCTYGVWIGVTPICNDLRCNTNQLNYPGLVKSDSDVYEDESSFKVACENGYELTELDVKFVCKGGKWEGPITPCTPGPCLDDPPKVPNGHAIGFNKDHASTIKYNCDEHYLLRGESTVQCWYGEWIGDVPKCIDSRCYLKNLKTTEGVTIQSSNITLSGTRLKVKCAAGYSPSSRLPLCFIGEWEEESPACETNGEVLPEELPVHEHQFVEREPSPEADVSTEKTTSPVPKSTEGITQRPELQKPQVPEARNTTTEAIKCSCTYYNQNLHVVAFSGNRQLKHGSKVELGDGVKFHCKELGYRRLTGPKEIKCESCKTWQWVDFPTCREPLWDETNVVINSETKIILPGGVVGIREGDSVEFPCYGSENYEMPEWFYHGPIFPSGIQISGYGIVGYRVTCMKIGHVLPKHAGTYDCRNSGKIGTLLHLKLLANCNIYGEVASGLQNTGKHRYKTGEFFNPSCKKGYQLSKPEDSQLTCVDGEWEGHIPPCKPVEVKQCDAFEEVTHIVHYDNDRKINSSAMFFCRKLSHKAVGPTVLSCLPNGKWSGLPPRCEGITCPELADIEGLEVSYSDELNVGSRATFQCTPPRSLIGPYQIKCEKNGTWSMSLPSCENVNCPEIVGIEGMEVSFSDELHVGSTATFHCFPPRELKGLSQIRCKKDGSWSGSVPSCSFSNCTLESLFDVVPENVEPVVENVTGDAVPYNSSLILTCSKNLNLMGNPAAKCSGLGKWEVGNVQCVRGCSPVVKPPSSQVIIEPKKDFFRFGEFMFYSCPDRFILTPDVQRVLCLGDSWSESKIPDCVAQATSLPTL